MGAVQKAVLFFVAVMISAMVVVPPSVWSDTVGGLNTFNSGETARASEVNQNFTAVESAVDGNDGLIADLESRVAAVEATDAVPGPQGEQGDPGPQGVQGPAGEGGASFELVGFTSTTYTGGEGVLGYTLACHSEFPSSRMCTSVEVMNTANVPVGLTGDAWVRPVFFDHFIYSGGGSALVAEISGYGGSQTAYHLTCAWWDSNQANVRGLSVDSFGRLDQTTCDASLEVACCRQVTTP